MLLFAAEAGAFGLRHDAGVHTVNTDVVRMTDAFSVKRTVHRLTLHIQRRFWLADCISGAAAALLPEAGATGLVGHRCLPALHKNIVLGTLFVRIVHAV